MNTLLYIIFLLVLSVEHFQLYQKVEATRNDAISLPLGSWFNSIEVLNNQNTEEIKADISKKDQTPQEVPVKRKKTKRRKKKRNKKWQKNSTTLVDGRRRFKKKMVTDDERETSGSYETVGRRKPINIIKSEEIEAENNSVENEEPKQVFVVRKRVVRKRKKVDRNWLKNHGNFSKTKATVTGRRFEPGRRAKKKVVGTKDRYFNVSESVEDSGEGSGGGIGRRKPVDIVVHIKMND